MSEETAVVDTETSEDTTNEKLFSIKESTLQGFGSLCRTLTNKSGELFDIEEIKEVLNWAQNEALTQKDLINQIEIVIYQKVNDEVTTDE